VSHDFPGRAHRGGSTDATTLAAVKVLMLSTQMFGCEVYVDATHVNASPAPKHLLGSVLRMAG